MVRIRMKSFGRRHRPFFRICAMDSRTAARRAADRGAGHYDPMVRNLEARTVLNVNRIRYWLSVGAQPSEKVAGAPEAVRVKKPAPGRALGGARDARAAPPAAAARGRRRPPAPAPRPRRRRRPRDRLGPDVAAMAASPPLRIDVLTLFPALFDGFLSESILKRAIDKGLVEVERWDIRDWAEGKHRQVDDRPFGGGPGMVLMAPPVVAAVEAVAGHRPSRPAA